MLCRRLEQLLQILRALLDRNRSKFYQEQSFSSLSTLTEKIVVLLDELGFHLAQLNLRQNNLE
jgi:hypothetical protein